MMVEKIETFFPHASSSNQVGQQFLERMVTLVVQYLLTMFRYHQVKVVVVLLTMLEVNVVQQLFPVVMLMVGSHLCPKNLPQWMMLKDFVLGARDKGAGFLKNSEIPLWMGLVCIGASDTVCFRVGVSVELRVSGLQLRLSDCCSLLIEANLACSLFSGLRKK